MIESLSLMKTPGLGPYRRLLLDSYICPIVQSARVVWRE